MREVLLPEYLLENEVWTQLVEAIDELWAFEIDKPTEFLAVLRETLLLADWATAKLSGEILSQANYDLGFGSSFPITKLNNFNLVNSYRSPYSNFNLVVQQGSAKSNLSTSIRTNFLIHSNELSGWNATDATVTPYVDATLNGRTVSRLFPTATTGVHEFNLGGNPVTTTPQLYRFSAFVKANGGQYFQMRVDSGTVEATTTFDLFLGEVVSSSSNLSNLGENRPLVESVGEGWYRCSISYSAIAVCQVFISMLDSGGNVSFLGDTLLGIDVANSMVEPVPSVRVNPGRWIETLLDPVAMDDYSLINSYNIHLGYPLATDEDLWAYSLEIPVDGSVSLAGGDVWMDSAEGHDLLLSKFSRTNYQLYSNRFEASNYTIQGISTVYGTPNFDLTNTATDLTASATTSIHGMRSVSWINTQGGSSICGSVFVLPLAGTSIILRLEDSLGGKGVSVEYLLDGTNRIFYNNRDITIFSEAIPKIEKLASGWYRCSLGATSVIPREIKLCIYAGNPDPGVLSAWSAGAWGEGTFSGAGYNEFGVPVFLGDGTTPLLRVCQAQNEDQLYVGRYLESYYTPKTIVDYVLETEFTFETYPEIADHFAYRGGAEGKTLLSNRDTIRFDHDTIMSQANAVGFKFFDDAYATDKDYQQIIRWVGQYWLEKGNDKLADFIGFCLSSQIEIRNLWTEDYITFVPEEGGNIGLKIYENGTWYPTTHVDLLYDLIKFGNTSQTSIRNLFNYFSPVNMVLRSLVQRLYTTGRTGMTAYGHLIIRIN